MGIVPGQPSEIKQITSEAAANEKHEKKAALQYRRKWKMGRIHASDFEQGDREGAKDKKATHQQKDKKKEKETDAKAEKKEKKAKKAKKDKKEKKEKKEKEYRNERKEKKDQKVRKE